MHRLLVAGFSGEAGYGLSIGWKASRGRFRLLMRGAGRFWSLPALVFMLVPGVATSRPGLDVSCEESDSARNGSLSVSEGWLPEVDSLLRRGTVEARIEALRRLESEERRLGARAAYQYQFGLALYRSGYLSEARRRLEKAIRLEPMNLGIRMGLAKIYLSERYEPDKLSDIKEAYRMLDNALLTGTAKSHPLRWETIEAVSLKIKTLLLAAHFVTDDQRSEVLERALSWTQVILEPLIQFAATHPGVGLAKDRRLVEFLLWTGLTWEKRTEGDPAENLRVAAAMFARGAHFMGSPGDRVGFEVTPGLLRNSWLGWAEGDSAGEQNVEREILRSDPSPETPINEPYIRFLARRAEAHLFFGDAENGSWGWSTPLGLAVSMFGFSEATLEPADWLGGGAEVAELSVRVLPLRHATVSLRTAVGVVSFERAPTGQFLPDEQTAELLDAVLATEADRVPRYVPRIGLVVVGGTTMAAAEGADPYLAAPYSVHVTIPPQSSDPNWWQGELRVIVKDASGVVEREIPYRIGESDLVRARPEAPAVIDVVLSVSLPPGHHGFQARFLPDRTATPDGPSPVRPENLKFR
jgi:hypothetical protein